MSGQESGISLGRVTTILLLSKAAGYALGLLNSIVLARSLGPDLLGEYAYAMGLAAIFGLIPHMGVATIVTRTTAMAPNRAAVLVRTALRAQAILAAGVLFLVPTVAAMLPEQPVSLIYVGLAAGQLAVGALSWPYLAVLGGHARYDRLAAAEFTTGLLTTISMVGVAAMHGRVLGFLAAQVLCAAAAVLVARWAAGPFIRGGDNEPMSLATLARQAAPFGATAFVQSIYMRLDILLLGQMASTAALGLYNVAYKPTSLAVSLGSTVAGTVLPVMAKPPREGIPTSFERAARALGFAGPAMALALTGMAEPLLVALYGQDFSFAAPILLLLAWSAAANWLYAPLGVALQARGLERGWLVALSAGTILNAGGNLWAIPRWGAVGAAGATLASELCVLAVGVMLVWRWLGFPFPLRAVFTGLASTLIACTALTLLQPRGAMVATSAAILVYGSLLFLFRVLTRDDIALATGWFRDALFGWSRPRSA